MAVLMSCATGNWLTAGTWALVDSTSYLNSESASTAITTSYVSSSTFTPGAITIDAIAIKVATRTATTGTLSIALDLATVTVSGTEVTINVADLNAAIATSLDGGWIVFKFANPVTLAGATAYGVKIKTSSASQVTAFSSATTNWSRALRTTTTQAPVAGDDTIVAGEHTGAGTGNNFTVTMNETATTDYGSNTTSTVTPALAICKRGTLKFNDASAANPKLRLSGHIIVYNGGTLNIGTTGTPIPRDSTAVLEFDCTADGDFGLVCRNSSITTMQGLSRTSGKNIVACKLASNASASGGAPSTSTLTIDADTGWLSGDQIAIASTSQTAADCETGTLNADAGASSIVVNNMTAGAAGTAVPPTSNRGLLVAHSGTAPTQAEIILLTRNVKVRSTSATTMTYIFIDCAPASSGTSVDVDWTQFYFLGENTINKQGLHITYSATFAGSVNVQFSSIHDCEDYGLTFGSNLMNTTLSNNTMWNLATITGPACQIVGTSTATNWVFDRNIIIRNSNSNCWNLADIGGTFTNNTVAGSAVAGFSLNEAAPIGTMTGLIAHSCSAAGVQTVSSGMSGSFNGTCWRNGAGGFVITSAASDLIFDNIVAFGNANSNVSCAGGDLWLKSPTLNGDSSFVTANGVVLSTLGSACSLLIDSGDLSTSSGIKSAHSTSDISITVANLNLHAVLRNTKLGAAQEVGGQSALSNNGSISSQKNDQVAGSHKTWMKNGTIQTDATTYNTSPPSLQMTPASSSSGAASFFYPLLFTGDITNNSVVVSNVSSFASVVDGMAVAIPNVITTTIISHNAGAGTLVLANPADTTAAGQQFLLPGKLESAPQHQGLKIAVNNGNAATVSAYVKKRADNLFTYSEDFSNATWSIVASTRTGGQTDPLGGTAAHQLLETSATTSHGLARATLFAAKVGTTYTLSLYVKPIGRQWIRILPESTTAWFDIINGVTGTVQSGLTATITPAANGFYRLAITFVATGTNFFPLFYEALTDGGGIFAGDVTKGFVAWGCQLEVGSTVSPYQITTTSNQIGYNGSQPRLIQRANPALGQNNDIVLATASAGKGTWQQISGTTSTATDDGAWEIVVDCDGITGAVNIDDFAAS